MAKQKFNFNAINAQTETKPEVLTSTVENSNTSVVGTIAKKLDEVKERPIFDVHMIPRKKIRENLKNHYPKVKMESLEESILNFGLQQNLLVIYLLEEDMYVIEAGHRRCAALDNLIQKYSSWIGDNEDKNYKKYLQNVSAYEKGYPCKVSARINETIIYDTQENDLDLVDEAVIDSEIRVIITNEEVRDTDPAVRSQNVMRLADLYERKNIGKSRKDMINVNSQIAKDLGISERQVINYKSITHLIPELQEEFKNRNISLKEGSGYSKLNEEEQRLILNLLHSGEKINLDELSTMKKEKEILEKKLHDVEIELMKRTSSGEPGSLETSKEDQQELKNLKKEFAELKAKKSETLLELDPSQAELIKKDLVVKSQFDLAEKQLKLLVEQVRNLKELQNENETTGISVLSENEVRDRIYKLIQILQGR